MRLHAARIDLARRSVMPSISHQTILTQIGDLPALS
jgi:hypothetical protein